MTRPFGERRRTIAWARDLSHAVRRAIRPDRRLAVAAVRAPALVVAFASCLSAAFVATPSHAADDDALARAKNCLNCHALDRKVVGPAYRDVAKRYAGDRDAEARLALKIRRGGAGAWGVVPMPANAVTPDEAVRLARWVLMQN